jgi:hypothetical protein
LRGLSRESRGYPPLAELGSTMESAESSKVSIMENWAGIDGSAEAGCASGRSDSVLLVTTVDVGEGLSKTIEMRRSDDPEIVAKDFAAKNGIPASIVKPLAAHLEEHFREALLVRAFFKAWSRD